MSAWVCVCAVFIEDDLGLLTDCLGLKEDLEESFEEDGVGMFDRIAFPLVRDDEGRFARPLFGLLVTGLFLRLLDVLTLVGLFCFLAIDILLVMLDDFPSCGANRLP